MRHTTFGNPAVERVMMPGRSSSDPLTVEGVARKVAFLLTLTLAAAAWSWSRADLVGGVPSGLLYGSILVALALAVLTGFRPGLAPLTGPLYAAVKGAAVGGLSWMYDVTWEGIPTRAALITLVIAASAAFLYTTGRIRPSEQFRATVATLTLGVLLLYVATLLLPFVGVQVTLVTGVSGLSLAFSVGVLVLAAANLVVDFDHIATSAGRVDRSNEWPAAFAVLTTVIWIYVEALRLLAKLNARR